MSAGIEFFDKNGRLTFSATDHLGRVLGIVHLPGADGDGHLDDGRLQEGQPFAVFFSDGNRWGELIHCIATVSGTRIHWRYGGPYANQGNNPGGYLVYGIR